MEASVFAGVDWANQVHRVFVLDSEGGELFEGPVPHTAKDLLALGD